MTLGPLGDSLVAIVTAESEDHTRIVSMGTANRYEQAIATNRCGAPTSPQASWRCAKAGERGYQTLISMKR